MWLRAPPLEFLLLLSMLESNTRKLALRAPSGRLLVFSLSEVLPLACNECAVNAPDVVFSVHVRTDLFFGPWKAKSPELSQNFHFSQVLPSRSPYAGVDSINPVFSIEFPLFSFPFRYCLLALFFFVSYFLLIFFARSYIGIGILFFLLIYALFSSFQMVHSGHRLSRTSPPFPPSLFLIVVIASLKDAPTIDRRLPSSFHFLLSSPVKSYSFSCFFRTAIFCAPVAFSLFFFARPQKLANWQP